MIDIERTLDKEDSEHDKLVQPREIDKEMRRLARLGIWAEKHGIPALNKITNGVGLDMEKPGNEAAYALGCNLLAHKALAALPKESQL